MSAISKVVRDYKEVDLAQSWARKMIAAGLRGGEVLITLSRPTRSSEQNRKMWAMLRDVARQRQLMINGEMVWAEADDWKDIFTAALKRETRMAQGLDGGLVLIGMRTSKLRKEELSELIELIYAYGSEWGVTWSADAAPALSDDPVAA